MIDNVVALRPAGAEAEREMRQHFGKTARLEKADPPILAANLGRFAVALEPERPIEGAKRMFKKAFGAHWEQYWRKRRRLVRLPGEAAPEFKAAGDYEAGGQKYLNLCDAYIDLIGDKFRKEQAFRRLTRGTSLRPEPTHPPSDSEGAALAAECLDVVSRTLNAAGTTSRAFDILRLFPIRRADNGFFLQPSRSPAIDLADLGHSHPEYGIPWFIPRLELGKVYFPIECSILPLGATQDIDAEIPSACFSKARERLSESMGDNLSYDEQHVITLARTIHLPSLFRTRLAEAGFSTAAWDRWEVGQGFAAGIKTPGGIVRPGVFVRYSVGILAFPHEQSGHPELRVSICSDEIDTQDEMLGCFTPAIVLLVGGDESVVDDNFVIHRDFVYAVPSWTELYEANFGDGTGIYPLSAPEAEEIILTGQSVDRPFKNAVWDDLGKFAMAPQMSVAATIIRNLTYGPIPERIDQLLVADAEQRLRPLLLFFEGERQALNEARDV